jgi:hypothetical protein
VFAALIAVAGAGVALTGCGQPAVASPSAAAASVQAGASAPAASGLTTPGGPIAEALVRVLRADPFLAHVESTTVARTTSAGLSIRITAKAVGDVSGKDVSLHVTSTGAGPDVEQDLVSVGDTVWIRRGGAATWEVHPRASAASAIDGLLATIRLIGDPDALIDEGVESIDGRQLHHLSAAGWIDYRPGDGSTGAYDRFDVWVTPEGVPVIAKGAFSAERGTDSIVGNTDVRYSQVGGPIAIVPPPGAPSPSS